MGAPSQVGAGAWQVSELLVGAGGITVLPEAGMPTPTFDANFDWQIAAGNSGVGPVSAVTNGIVNVGPNAALTLTGRLLGLSIDFANAAGNQQLTGEYIGIPATTAADVATTATAAGAINAMGSGALVIFDRATVQRAVDVVTQKRGGTIAAIRYPAGLNTTPTATRTGLLVDLTTNVVAAAFIDRGVDVLVGPSSNAGTRGVRVTSTSTGVGAACLELLPTPGAGAGVSALVVTGTGFSQGNLVTFTDPAMIADGTSALTVTQAPAATASTDRLAISVNYNPTLVPAGGINSGAAASRLVLINNSPIINAAQTLTIRRALLDIVNAGDALLAGSTVTDQTPLLRIQHSPTATAGTYNDNAVVGAAIVMTSPAASTCIGETIAMSPAVASACTGLRVTVGTNMTGPAIDLVGPGAGANVAFIQFIENAANDAAAGGVNTGRLYARDNGAGKTQLVCRFNTGAVQVLATEP